MEEAHPATDDIKRPRKRVAKCSRCGHVYNIDDPAVWEFANIILRDVICSCGSNTFQIMEVLT